MWCRNHPCGGQQEGAPHRPDRAGAAAGCDLGEEPSRAPLPHAGSGRARDRLLQTGRNQRLHLCGVGPSAERLPHLPLCRHEETGPLLRGTLTKNNPENEN